MREWLKKKNKGGEERRVKLHCPEEYKNIIEDRKNRFEFIKKLREENPDELFCENPYNQE